MAKATKASAKPAKKKAEPKKSPAKKSSSVDLIIQACELSLAKLNELNIDHALQSEINWCLGSFKNDFNPVGLYEMAERSIVVFKGELTKKSKGVTTKLIKDIESALKAR